jgi:hypothetical protein
MRSINSVEDFDKVLIETIDETLKYSLGDRNAAIIEEYMEKQGLPIDKIPQNPEWFSEELRNIMGGKLILGPAIILEETILKMFGRKIGRRLLIDTPVNFPREVKALRDSFASLTSEKKPH